MAQEQSERPLLAGRYRLLRTIGAGGMATVYEGEDVALGRPIAVKILHPRHAADEALISRFETEARALAALKHPAIVDVYDLGADDAGRFIVMELVPGQSVKQLVRHGPLAVDQIISIGVQIAKALECAHGAGLVHRDVKSHNIIVGPDGGAKLVDFGIVTAAGATPGDGNEVFGSVHYVAPEQARGEPASAATDIYSLGVVLYEMATGRVPFDGLTALDIATKQVSEEPEPPSSYNPAIPPSLEAAILQAMEKDPGRRPAEPGGLARQLVGLVSLHDQTTRSILSTARPTAEALPGHNRLRRPDAAGSRRPAATDPGPPYPSSPWPLFALAILALLLVAGLLPLWAAVLQPGRV